MSTYCQDSKKAEVKILSDDPLIVVSTNPNPPITVSKETQTKELITYSGEVGTPCYQPSAWLEPESPAVWVWDAPLSSPKANENEIVDFTVNFNSEKDQLFELICACDNAASITLNNSLVGNVYSFSVAKSFVITGNEGSNSLLFRCTNYANNSTDPQVNPAGLYFQLFSLDGCRIIITDQQGEIFNKVFNQCPKYEVFCDDNCPEGYLKCKSDKYPGYCCLSCQETANKIRALGTKLA